MKQKLGLRFFFIALVLLFLGYKAFVGITSDDPDEKLELGIDLRGGSELRYRLDLSTQVTAKDKRWAYDIVHQETMELLLQSPRFKLEFRGPHVMAYRAKRFKPLDFDQAFTLVEGILDRIPRDLKKELRSHPPA